MKHSRFLSGHFPDPVVGNSKPPALLMRGSKPCPETVKAIRERIDLKDFVNVHFNKSRKGELLIRFTNIQTIEEELKRMRDKLSDMGPEVIKNVITLGKLDRIIILDIDPSIAEVELLEALKTARLRNSRKSSESMASGRLARATLRL